MHAHVTPDPAGNARGHAHGCAGASGPGGAGGKGPLAARRPARVVDCTGLRQSRLKPCASGRPASAGDRLPPAHRLGTHLWRVRTLTGFGLTLDAARWLAGLPIALLGVETPSSTVDDHGVHQELLAKGVVIIEGWPIWRASPREMCWLCSPAGLAGLMVARAGRGGYTSSSAGFQAFAHLLKKSAAWAPSGAMIRRERDRMICATITRCGPRASPDTRDGQIATWGGMIVEKFPRRTCPCCLSRRWPRQLLGRNRFGAGVRSLAGTGDLRQALLSQCISAGATVHLAERWPPMLIPPPLGRAILHQARVELGGGQAPPRLSTRSCSRARLHPPRC